MDGTTRETMCNECLEFVKNAATAALEGADEAGFQKSDTLRQIVRRVTETLAKIDSAK
jgi:hypothetical protein